MNAQFILAWLFIYPIPAAICKDWNPHPMRTMAGLVVFPIIAAHGELWLRAQIRRLGRQAQRYATVSAIAILTANVFFFGVMYFREFPPVAQATYQAPLRRAIEWAAKYKGRADFILVTNWSNQPYIYALLAEPIPPRAVQGSIAVGGSAPLAVAGPHGFDQVVKVGRYYFEPLDPLRFPEEQIEFERVWRRLPEGAVGLVIERAGRFHVGKQLMTIRAGDRNDPAQDFEVWQWRPDSEPISR